MQNNVVQVGVRALMPTIITKHGFSHLKLR
jgi:hypothetical protein